MTGPVMSVVSPVAHAFDDLGNPLCPGCHLSPAGYAALANSGKPFGTCFCPPPDTRIDEPNSLADARTLLTEVLDRLEQATHLHALTCDCDVCGAARHLRAGGHAPIQPDPGPATAVPDSPTTGSTT